MSDEEVCPRCGAMMTVRDGSDRTWWDKVWYELICHNCLHRETRWKPRERKR